MTRAEVAAVVREVAAAAGTPADVTDRVIAGLLPSVRLVPAEPEGGSPPGGCRLGGRPDLPDGVDWPTFRHPDRGDLPYRFLMQIDLAAVAPCDPGRLLPPAGRLWFFLHWDDTGSDPDGLFGDAPRVLFHPDPATPLRRCDPPSGLPEPVVYRPLALAPALEWTAPNCGDLEVRPGERRDPLGLWDGLRGHLELWNDLGERLAAAQGFGPWWTPKHRMLGHPELIQAFGAGVGAGTVLLAQVDSDPYMPDAARLPRAGMMWGDAGTVYYLVGADDLAARRFDRASSIVEMS